MWVGFDGLFDANHVNSRQRVLSGKVTRFSGSEGQAMVFSQRYFVAGTWAEHVSVVDQSSGDAFTLSFTARFDMKVTTCHSPWFRNTVCASTG